MLKATLTNVVGVKFIVFTDPNRSSEELLLKKLYEIYSDYALKNPFYSLDMPVRYKRLWHITEFVFFYHVLHRITYTLVQKRVPRRLPFIMVALCNRADHYIFILFLSSFFLLLDVYHTSAHGVALVRM